MTELSQQTPAWRGAMAETGIYARIGVPILLTQLCMMANGVVDTLMAGRADRLEIGGFVRDTGLDSSLELAGVAIGNGIWVSLMMTALGFLFATTPMVAELYGAGKMTQIGRLVRRLVWSALLLGSLLTISGWVAAALVEPWMKPDTGAVTADYMRVVSFGALPLALGTLLRCYSEGMTLTRPITVITLISVLLNIPINAILIYGLFGLEPLGGVGCAAATAMVNWLAFLGTLAYVRFAKAYQSVNLFRTWRLPIHRYTIIRQMRIGTPIGITMLVELSMFPGMALLIAFKQLPDAITAGHQIAMNMAGVLYMFPLALSITATVRMGNLLGARAHDSLTNASRYPLFAATAVAFANTLVLLFFRDDIAGFYSRVPEVVATASYLLVFAMAFQWVDGLQGTALGTLRGLSSTFVPMVWIAVSYWAIGIPIAYMAAFVGFAGLQPMGIGGLWLGMTAGLLVAAVSLISYMLLYVGRLHRRLSEPARQRARRIRAEAKQAA